MGGPHLAQEHTHMHMRMHTGMGHGGPHLQCQRAQLLIHNTEGAVVLVGCLCRSRTRKCSTHSEVVMYVSSIAHIYIYIHKYIYINIYSI
jgi:hypothetical protein